MKNTISILTILTLGFFSNFALADSDHGHDHKSEKSSESHEHSNSNKGHDEGEGDGHGEREKHKEHDDQKKDDHDHDDKEAKESHGHDEEHGEEPFGEGSAITSVYNGGEKFKLSEASEKLLGIKVSPLESLEGSAFKIPNEALVRFQSHLGVFIKGHDGFELIELEKVIPFKDYVSIESKKLHKGVHVVTSGVPLLRVAHLQASGQGGKGHAH